MLLNEDEEIHGVYRVDRFLGEGAFAEVYRVKHRFLGRQAMKVFKAQSPKLEEVERDLAEAMLLSKIGHPNIIRVFDAGILETDAGRRGYFTMEYIPGGTLEGLMGSYHDSFVSIAVTMDIIGQVCLGMAAAHSKQPPVIHRDIKPQNILIGYDDEGMRIRLSDFGLAKAVNPLTLLASSKGTPVFKPPECLYDMDSCAADVWSIGVTLYLLLTNRLPFRFESRMDLSTGKCWESEITPAADINPRVDNHLETIVSRCLKLKSSERYPNAVEMLEDVRKWPSRKRLVSTEERIERTNHPGVVSRTPDRRSEAMALEAVRISRHLARLPEAADLLEKAIAGRSDLRDKYEYRLKLWRRGIVI